MLRPKTLTPGHLLVSTPALVLGLTLVVTGCSGSDAKAKGTDPVSTSGHGPALVSSGGGGGVCLQKVTTSGNYGFWNGALVAKQGLTIKSISVNDGSGIRSDGGVAAKVVRRPHQNPGTGISDWPIKDLGPQMRRQVDWKARTALKGNHLGAGETVVAFYKVYAKPGMSMTQFTVHYQTDSGATGTTNVDASLRFSAAGC